MTFQRARTDEQRAFRRRVILETATAMLVEMPVSELSLNELSRRVGLAKSNVLRYFESREAVLLQLLEDALRDWVSDVLDELTATIDPDGPATERGDRLAEVLAHSLAARPVLCDLIAAQPGVLEHNVSVDAVVRIKHSSIAALETLSDGVRTCVPELGDGAWNVCLMTGVLAGALYAHARPSASALAAYEADPAVAQLRLDLPSALEDAIATIVAGTLARSVSSRSSP